MHDDGATEVIVDNWRDERSAHRLTKAPWTGRTEFTMANTSLADDEPDEVAYPGETRKWMLDRQKWKYYACESAGKLVRIDHGAETLKGLVNAAEPRSRLVTSRKTEDLDTGEIIAEERFQDNDTLQELLLPPRRPGTQPRGKRNIITTIVFASTDAAPAVKASAVKMPG